MIEKYVQHQKTKGAFEEKRTEQSTFAFRRLLDEQLRLLLSTKPGLANKIDQLEKKVSAGELSPYSAVKMLFDGFEF